MDNRFVYRIPKNVETKNTLWGMGWRGWIATSIGAVFAILQFMLFHPHSFNGLIRSLIFGFFLVFLPVFAARDPQVLQMLRQTSYHAKNKKLIKWESDPNALLTVLKKSK